MGENIKLKCADGVTINAYVAQPAGTPKGGMVVIQEIFGINSFVKEVADAYAARGYFALAPDLFWRLEPNVNLTDKTPEDWQKAFSLMQRFDIDKGVSDIQTSITHLRGLTGVSGKIGAVGYCLGGQLAFLTATRTDADASVGYYGVYIQTRLGEAKAIKKPLLLHIAGKDQFVPPEAQAQITEGLKGNTNVTLHTYPDMDHAFARTGGQHYEKANADLANKRTEDFFRKNLG